MGKKKLFGNEVYWFCETCGIQGKDRLQTAPIEFMSVYLKSETGDKVELCMKSSKRVAKDYGELRPYAHTLGKKLCIGSNTEVHTRLK